MRKQPRTPSPLENIRRARTLTQQQLADLVGISQQSLGKAEIGKLKLSRDVEERIAAILGVARLDVFPDIQSEPDRVAS